METVDITQLGLTAEPEPVPADEYIPPYDDNTGLPVDKGIYEVKFVDGKFKEAPEKVLINGGAARMGKLLSKKNNVTYLSGEFALSVQDAQIGGKNAGTRTVWGRVNTMPESLIFQNVKEGRQNANAFLDLLKASGYKGSLRSNEDYTNGLATLIEEEAQARARLDWSAYCNPNSSEYAGCGHTVRGAKNFPQNSDGSYNPRMECPGDHPSGQRPVLLARNEVRAVYPKK